MKKLNKAQAYLHDIHTGNIDIINAEYNEGFCAEIQFLSLEVEENYTTLKIDLPFSSMKAAFAKQGITIGSRLLRIADREREIEMQIVGLSADEICKAAKDAILSIDNIFSHKVLSKESIDYLAQAVGFEQGKDTERGVQFVLCDSISVMVRKSTGRTLPKGQYELNAIFNGRVYFQKYITDNIMQIFNTALQVQSGQKTKSDLERAYDKKLSPFYNTGNFRYGSSRAYRFA